MPTYAPLAAVKRTRRIISQVLILIARDSHNCVRDVATCLATGAHPSHAADGISAMRNAQYADLELLIWRMFKIGLGVRLLGLPVDCLR